jgi:hypothetical protein
MRKEGQMFGLLDKTTRDNIPWQVVAGLIALAIGAIVFHISY